MLRFSANLSLLFCERPLLERFSAARACGFEAVEIQNPYEIPAAALAAAAEQAGVRVVLINAPMGPAGAPGIACRPEHRARFREELSLAGEYAATLKVPAVNVLAGRAAPAERATCRALLIEHLSLASGLLAARGARALLEAINPLDVADYCVDDFALACRVLDACTAPVGLQFDIYHAARMGLDPLKAFEAVRSRVAHVQFADCPGRHEPGSGTLDFAELFRAIEASGYAGWLGAEYRPSRDTAATLHWLAAREGSR